MDVTEAMRVAWLSHDIGRLFAREANEEVSDDGAIEHSVEFLEAIGKSDAATLVNAYSDGEDRRDVLALTAARSLARPTDEEVTFHGSDGYLADVFGTFTSRTDRGYPLQPLDLSGETFMATSSVGDKQPDYQTLAAGLRDAVGQSPSYERLDSLLERYAWCVPSTLEGGTLPLYDFSRTTAALAEALYRSDLDDQSLTQLARGETVDGELFTLVKGDISGIQSFIHQVRNPDDAQERFAKRLRGRSTQIWLLTEGLARLFLDRLDLPTTSVIWSGGGQFYALVPATAETQITSFEREVNQWLLDRYNADLFFVVGRDTATTTNETFSKLFGRVASDADRRKNSKAAPAAHAIKSAVLGPPVEPCRSCGRDNLQGGDRCRECDVQETLGGKSATASYLSATFAPDERAQFTLDLPEGELSWRLSDEPTDWEYCLRLNDTSIANPDLDGFVFTGATVPHGGAVDRVWSFRELADMGRSDTDFVHVTKMDIDSLGEAISSGMDAGPARLAALSRALDRFFAGYTNTLATDRAFYELSSEQEVEGDEADDLGEIRGVDHSVGPSGDGSQRYYRPSDSADIPDDRDGVSPIYIGFAGGDDMFFVGPWDEAVGFAQEIRSQFKSYTNGTLTLSGGFFLTKSSYPVGRAVKQAETALEQAKEFSYEDNRKNAAQLFDETTAWEFTTEETPGMDELLTFGERLETLVNTGDLSRSILNDISTIGNEEYPEQVSPSGVSLSKDSTWRLKYLLARHFDDELLREMEDELPRTLPWISVPVSWATLATR